MGAKPWVKVDGKPLATVAPGWGDPIITHRFPSGGCWEMSWDIPVRRQTRQVALLARKTVEAFVGATPVWSGFMTEPNWDTGEMVAQGWVRQGEEAICFDGTGKTTSIPDTAIDQAVVRGALTWVRRSSISTAAFSTGTVTDRFNYITALMDAYHTANTLGWGINARREIFSYSLNAATPSLAVYPDSGALGTSDAALAGKMYGRYLNAATSRLETTSVGTGTPEVGVDLTAKLGPTTAAAVQTVLNGMIAKLGARGGWTNGLSLTEEQITTMGGAGASLALVTAGQTMRLHGLRDLRGLGAYTDIVLSETQWNVAEQTVEVTPLGYQPRDLGSIVEEGGGTVL